MSSANRTIKAALKRRLVPHLIAAGFTGSYPDFRRRDGGRLHLLSVQFDKWGGGFMLEFASQPGGDLTMAWGEVVPEARLTTAYAAIADRARLLAVRTAGATAGDLRESWFRFEGLDPSGCDALVGQVIALLPQVDAWLRTRQPGPNISTFGTFGN